MAEVPPHLLERSRSRRAALGLATGEGGAPEAAAAPAATPVKAAAAEPATAAPVAAAVAVAPPPVAPPPPKTPPRIPRWMMPVLVGLPVWIFFYMGMFTTQKVKLQGPEAIGAATFSANCASCHAADGGGGVGPKLRDGEAANTFSAIEDQIAFVKAGSPAAGTPYGDADREGGQRVAKGGMPAWGGTLTDEQIAAVVAYERSVLSGLAFPTDVPGLEAAAAAP